MGGSATFRYIRFGATDDLGSHGCGFLLERPGVQLGTRTLSKCQAVGFSFAENHLLVSA